jgi:Ca2+-binding EF-hand superfamily protein
MSKAQIRNSVALARIDQNVRKVHSMIHMIQPPSHDEVILPKNQSTNMDHGHDEMNKLRTEEQKMKIRLLKSAAMVPVEAKSNMRPLDRESIDKWVSKMKNATEMMGDGKHKDNLKKKKKREVLSQAAINALEKQLQQAIRGEYRSRIAKVSKVPSAAPAPAAGTAVSSTTAAANPVPAPVAEVVMPSVAAAEVKKALTTRALLPYYKLESVHQFMDIFAKVDENFSGDLDVNEWIKLFTSLNESVPVQEARMIFMKIDKDCDGYLTMRELVPVVFSKASKEQQRLIIAYAEMELTKKVEHENIPKVTNTDLEQLFESYDGENIGFVDVSLIKERVRAMNLSEQALFFFMDNISDLADDEMVNLIEFKRLFKMYTATR